MRCTRYLIAGLAGFRNVLVAADITKWMTEWSTTTCWSTKEAETMWSTEYSTTTCWSTSTPPAVTVYDTITSSTTVEIPYTTTSIVEKDFTTTLYSSFAEVVTSVETAVETTTVTKLSVYTVTIASLATSIETSVNIVPGKGYTSTIVIQNTKTITQACSSPTSTLTGLVLCPSRTVNTDYTPPTALPVDYTWGCPPGTLCKPPQINCNFEVDLPDEGYVCNPKDCITPEPVPADYGGPFAADYNSTCPWYEPFDSYFNMAPTLFELTYSIFAVESLGIAAGSCPPTPAAPPPPPPPSTTTTSSIPPPPPPPPTTAPTTTTPSYSSVWIPWTTSSYVYVPPPVSSSSTQWLPWTTKSSVYVPPVSSATWSYGPPAPVVSSSTWAEWAHSSSVAEAWTSPSAWDDGQSKPYAAHTTAPPSLSKRAPDNVPAACYAICNKCAADAQFQGKVPALCASSAKFQLDLNSCQACVTANKADVPKDVRQLATKLDNWVNYCNGAVKQISTSATAPPVVVTTTPKPPPTTTPSPPPTPPKSTSTSVAPTTTPATTSVQTTSVPPTTTTPSATTPAVIITTTTPSSSSEAPGETVCPVSEFTDGQPQATSCVVSVASSSSSPTVAPYTSSGAQPTQRPAAAMVVGVVIIMAMV